MLPRMPSLLDRFTHIATPLSSEGKAVVLPAPDPAGVLPTGTPGSRIAQRGAKAFLGTYGGNDAVDTVMECVDVYAQAISNADFHFTDSQGTYLLNRDKTGDDPESYGEAPLSLRNLLSNPNPWQDYTELMELLVIDFLLTGNGYWLKYGVQDRGRNAGKPLALYRLSPQLIEIVPGSDRLIKGYRYRVPGEKAVEFDAKDVIHFRRPNPHDPYYGLGVIAGGPGQIDIELAMTASLKTYYEQGTRLSGVLESERTVTPSAFEKIKRHFAALYTGRGNDYKVAVLERGLKFKPMSATAAEAEFNKLAPMSQERIAKMFKVPKVMLGETTGADRQAVREAKRIFANDILRPFINRLQSRITASLTEAWDVQYVNDYKYVMPIEDQLDLAQTVSAVPGVLVREVRETAGFGPLGEKFTMPDGTLIDDVVLNLPGDDKNESDVKDRNLADEAGRPPKGENTAAFNQGDTPDDAEVVSGS